MEGNAIINELAEQGITLTLKGTDKLIAKPTAAITPEVAETIRENKPGLRFALLVAEGMSEELAYEESGLAKLEAKKEEEEYDAWWEAKLASQPEIDPCHLPGDEYEEYSRLTDDQQDTVVGWIEENLEEAPEKTERYRRDSYGLKHDFERSPEGFYVSDAQFRCGMWLLGFCGRRYPGRRYEDLESRYYYLQPNYAGLIRKLEGAGVPSGWARDAIIEAHPDPEPDPALILEEQVQRSLIRCAIKAKGPVSMSVWRDATATWHPSMEVAEFAGAADRLIEKGTVERTGKLYRPVGFILGEDGWVPAFGD